MSPHIRAAAGLVLAATLTFPAAPANAVPDFTEQTQFGAAATISVAWGDYDLDGDLDLVVANNGSQNRYCRNDGGGVFSVLARFSQGQTFAIAGGDIDNDGDLDVAVGNGGAQANLLAINNGGGSFTNGNAFGANNTIAFAWADVDLDGDLDLAVGNGLLANEQQNYLYLNNGDGTFTEEAQFGIGKSASLVWGDADGDGDPDLAVGNGGFGFVGQNYLYVNNGDGTYTEREEFGMGDTSCLVWGDSDGDGDLDLAVANWNDGQNLLYVNDGAGNFTSLDRFGLRDPNTMAWGDFDDDGDLDLAVGNGDFSTADQNYLYINEGGNTFTESAQFGLGSTDGLAWGDADGDGDLDLACGNEHTPATNYLYVNNADDSDWLELHLVGHFHDLGAGYSNRDGIGAKVAVYEAGFIGDAGHFLGMREIEAHGGFACQNAIEAHFGLPGQSTVDVRVTWPGSAGSNLVQDYLGIAVPSRTSLHEGPDPTSAPVPAASGSMGFRLTPNPTRGLVTIELAGRVPAAGDETKIFDATGRLVRRLTGAAPTADASVSVEWDGRDAVGRPVSAGVYFVRADGVAPSGRIVVIR